MTKDRQRRYYFAPDVLVVMERSSTHPIEYVFVLLVQRYEQWHTVRTFDNAHGSEEHHEHRYVGGEKQAPVVTHGPVNQAMHAAEIKLSHGWGDIVRSWESTL